MKLEVNDELVVRARDLIVPLDARSAEEVLKAALRAGIEALEERGEKLVDTQVERGKRLYGAEAYPAAVEAFQEAWRMDSSSADTAFLLGLAWERNENVDGAIGAYEQCLRLSPEHDKALKRIAISLHKAQRYEGAVAAYDRALDREPGASALISNRADCLRMLGMNEDCLDDYGWVLSRQPHDLVANVGKATALNALRRFDEAVPHWEIVVELSPGDEIAKAGLELARGWHMEQDRRLSPERQLQRDRDERCIQWNHRGRKVICDNPLCTGRFPDALAALEAMKALKIEVEGD